MAHNPTSTPEPPVLHLHGYQSSSAEVVLRGRKNSLGFLLSDQGYDVWLLNFRGNVYSRNHTVKINSLIVTKLQKCSQELSPDDKFGPFWNFTWWEMGSKDLPSVLEYILDLTGQNK